MMENSISSSQNQAISAAKPIIEADDPPEESGWTQYIEDFEAEYNNGYSYSGCCSCMSASMVSDAGSGPEWKRQDFNTKGVCPSFGVLPNMPKRLNFKKKIPFDDSLEDTASSPVNSPKITAFFNKMDLNSRKMESDNGSPMGDDMSMEKQVEYNDVIREHDMKDNYNCIELKQKGLCLVPVSMVVNYLDS